MTCKRILAVFVAVSILCTSDFFTSVARASSVVSLGVTQITAVQTYATADGTFEHGWRWVFDVTIPENETMVKMKFADWTSGANVIATAEHVRFYSAQSLNASSADTAVLTHEAGVYGDAMNLNLSADLDAARGGRQVQITVETAVPVGSAGGSYSTSYGIKTDIDPNISIPASPETQAAVTLFVNTDPDVRREGATLYEVNVANMVDVPDQTNIRYKVSLAKNGQPSSDLNFHYASRDAFSNYASGSFTTDLDGIAYLDPVYGRLLSVGSMDSLKSFGGLTTSFAADTHIPYGDYAVTFSVVKVNSDGSYTELTATTSKTFVAPMGYLTRAFNGPATGNVAKNSQDKVFYQFALSAGGGASIEIQTIHFSVTSTHDVADLTDVKLKNLDTGTVVSGPVSLGTGSISSDVSLVLDAALRLSAGETVNLGFTADVVNQDVVTGSQILFGLNPFRVGDVQDLETGEDFPLSHVIPNTAIQGNSQTVIASSLTAALASTPAITTVVKKQANIPTAGFVLTAGTDSGATISRIDLQGAATTTETATSDFRYAYFNDLVASCGLYDGDTLIKSDGPDANGVLTFSSLNISIAAGASKTLVAKCTALSTISGTPAFAVGLSSVIAQDDDDNEITVDVANADNNLDADAQTATIYQKFAVNGTGSLQISTGSQPEATIILGSADVKLAEFRATAVDESVQITKVNVSASGDAAALTQLKIRVKGSDTIYGTANFAAETDSSATSTLITPIIVDKDATKTIEVWGNTGTVASPASTSGAKSGGVVRISVNPNSFEIYGLTSGEKLVATGAVVSGNTMVLRKSKPTVTILSVPTTLSSGVQKDLIKFHVSADAAGDVAWKQIVFSISTTTAVKTLTGFKLHRGSSDITTDSVSSTVSLYTHGTDGSTFTLTLKDGKEEVVSGSGVVYTLSATPTLTSPTSGDSITIKIREESASTSPVTGTVVAQALLPSLVAGGTAANSSFVWSDLSVPGSPLVGNGDWTNGVFVKDLTTSSALVY